MTAIALIVTAAGRAALVNAQANGTNAVTVAQAGLTSTAFAADAAMTALPGEFGRITVVSGAVVDPATIHLVISDDGAAAYALRGFGLYLADGTLFALYGQGTPILEKTPQSSALIQADVRFADIDAQQIVFSGGGFLNPPATTEQIGVVELATEQEAGDGEDAQRAVTPKGLRAAIDRRFGSGSASAFVRTLLTAAHAAAFRALLGIRGAALKDEGPGQGLNADMVDGLHAHVVSGTGGKWPHIPVVGGDGVMEVGRYIDFHAASDDPQDFGARLELLNGQLCVNNGRIWTDTNDAALLRHRGPMAEAQLNAPRTPGLYQMLRNSDSVALLDVGGFGGSTPRFQLVATWQGQLLFRAARDFDTNWGSGQFHQLWHTGNDGSGSGLDADLLDGQDGAWFANIPARLGYTPWGPFNDGSGSGLDADLLDGRDASSFANAAHSHGAADLLPAFAQQQLATDGYQVLPGGLILQWGRVRQFLSGEPAVNISFPIPFPNACLSITGNAHINFATSSNRDHWLQTVGNPSQFGATFQLQSDGGTSSDGINWFAIGY